MKTVPLKAVRRSGGGKQQAKKIRAAGGIPAVVYGSGMKSLSIQVGQDDFDRAIHTKAGENVIIRLEVTGDGKGLEKTVVIKEVQHHPATDAIRHVDFNAISLTEKIKVNVPFQVIGQSAGVKEGGILDVVHHEIEVECFPTDIPERLSADISTLPIGGAIHIRELSFPKGVVTTLAPDEVVVTVHAPKVEEALAVEEAPAEPEVIGKEKKEEVVTEGPQAEPAAPKTGAKESKGPKEGKEGKEAKL